MFFQRFDRHSRLMNSMADALGTDLEVEVLSGRLAAGDYRERLMRCVSCRNAQACARLLETAEGFLEEAPDYCRNKASLDAMSR